MLSKCDPAVTFWLRGCIYPAYLVTGRSLESVQVGKSARWEAKTLVEVIEKEHADAMASGHEFPEKRPAGMSGIGCGKRIGHSKDVVL